MIIGYRKEQDTSSSRDLRVLQAGKETHEAQEGSEEVEEKKVVDGESI